MVGRAELSVSTPERALWGVVGITLVSWAFLLLGSTDAATGTAVLEVLIGAWGLAVIVVTWTTRGEASRTLRVMQWMTVGMFALGFLAWSWMQIRTNPAYGTDEIAFDQYAAQIAAHWHNPYTHSMLPSFPEFAVSPNGYTFHLNGTPVSSLSYPAMSFLLYVPLVWLGLTAQMAVVVNVVLWIAAVTVAFALLPRDLRALAIIVGSLPIFTGFAVGGVTDVVYLVPLMLAVYQWDRYASFGRWRSIAVPVSLGMALSVKQTPWLIAPFVLTGIYLEIRSEFGRRRAVTSLVKYCAWAGGTFVVVNGPFIVSNGGRWLAGVLTPISSNTVPAGQGTVAMSLFLGIGGGNLVWFSLTLVAVAVLVYMIYALTYPRWKSVAVLAPSLILFFSARSFSSYMVILILPVLVALVSIDWNFQTTLSRPRWWWRASLAAVAACVVGGVVASLASSAPLVMAIESIRTTGQLATIVQVNVNVENNTSHRVAPHFTVQTGGSLTAFWVVSHGPSTLGAHARATYSLLAPNFFAQPPLTSGFQVVAFSERPHAVSVTSAFVADQYHVNLTPEAVNAPVKVGRRVTFTAQVATPFNQPVRRAGLPVFLGQIIYTQSGLVYGQASINGNQPGKTPVIGYTNSRGEVKFTVVGTRARNSPVYFEANLLNGSSFYPYGYSDIVPIRFSKRG